MRNVRTWLVLFVALTLLGAIWGLKERPEVLPGVQRVLEKEIPTHDSLRKKAVVKILDHKETVKSKVVKVDLSSLQGRKLGDLYATYLGLPKGGTVPRFTTVSFEERMATMYHQKVEYKKCKKKKKEDDPENCTVASDTVLAHAPHLLEKYLKSDKMTMNLEKFIAIADEKVRSGRAALDWATLCKRGYRLNAEKCALLQAIVANVNGKDLVAYGMTELLPSSDGQLNIRYMDVLLRNAGAEFLYYVPALGDRYASLGLYQFTFFALRDDPQHVEGVSRVNAYVKMGSEKVPGSVVLLQGHQHHTAAFYFAVHNLATILHRLNERQMATLSNLHQKEQGAMIVIIAAAHHGPAHTQKTVKTWLNAVYEAAHPKKDGKKKKKAAPVNTNLLTLFPEKADMRMYALKSYRNLAAVYELK